jgi:FlaA1/EpsC-like NDP-sugar epimerase
LKGSKVLLTGGAGSLGRAIVQKILPAGPEQIIIYSRDEAKHAQYYSNEPKVKCVIGDVRDFDKLLLTTKGIDYLVHAGALKRIDALEYNPIESIRTNVDGTINVARAAYMNKVKKCVLVSTDKACMATSTYGSTKFLGEKVFSYFDYEFGEDTIFASVRYGNVVASTGSFIPYWIERIKKGDSVPVTVLHMTRFLFTLDEAAMTVLKALKYSEGGEIFLPRIKSFKIEDVMQTLADYYGASLKVENVGKRAGEKIHEDLMNPIELERTYALDTDVLVVVPELSRRAYTYKQTYEGPRMNSELFVEGNHERILELLKRGMVL